MLALYNGDDMSLISVVRLGNVGYGDGLRLQKRLVGLRKAGEIGDVLLLLEHTPVITLGRNAKAANVLASIEELASRGVEVYECDRGGDVTFHGPGQIVAYPIFDLRNFSRQPSAVSYQEGSQVPDLRSQENAGGSDRSFLSQRGTLGAVDYVRRLEEVLIRTCGDFGIPSRRVAGLTGVWTEAALEGADIAEDTGKTQGPSTPQGDELRSSPCSARDDRSGKRKEGEDVGPSSATAPQHGAKIAAIGVHISRSVTSHGFALNVNTDLSYFNLIVPCGITAKPVTSMAKELGRELEIDAVAHALSRNFGTVFGRQMLWVETLDALLGQTVGVPMRAPKELREVVGEDDSFLA